VSQARKLKTIHLKIRRTTNMSTLIRDRRGKQCMNADFTESTGFVCVCVCVCVGGGGGSLTTGGVSVCFRWKLQRSNHTQSNTHVTEKCSLLKKPKKYNEHAASLFPFHDHPKCTHTHTHTPWAWRQAGTWGAVWAGRAAASRWKRSDCGSSRRRAPSCRVVRR